MAGEIVEQATGLTFGIFSAIAYENGTHNGLLAALSTSDCGFHAKFHPA
jgi:hypothetical protein